jgi:hypothetical protein
MDVSVDSNSNSQTVDLMARAFVPILNQTGFIGILDWDKPVDPVLKILPKPA